MQKIYNNYLMMSYVWVYLPNNLQTYYYDVHSTMYETSPSQPPPPSHTRPHHHTEVREETILDHLIVLTKEDLLDPNNAPSSRLWTEQEDRLLLFYRDQQHMQWDCISKKIQGRKPKMCYNRYHRLLFATKPLWRKKDDQKLLQLVGRHGQDWDLIGSHLKKWRPQEIKEHYMSLLRPDLSQEDWTVEEDLRLIALLNEYGRDWRRLEGNFPGRSLNQIKNRTKGRIARLNNKKIDEKFRLADLHS